MNKVKTIQVRLTDEEYAKLLNNLEKYQSVSSFLRQAIEHYCEVLNNE